MIALLCVIGSLRFAPEQVDLLELNHFFDRSGRSVFSQVIAWEVDQSTRKYRVRDWAMVEEHNLPHFVNGHVRFKMRKGLVSSRMFRESWTQTDPERDDLAKWPNDLRTELIDQNKP